MSTLILNFIRVIISGMTEIIKTENGLRLSYEDAEPAILGLIVAVNNNIFKVREMLQPEHFNNNRNRQIYETMLWLADQENTDIDDITIISRLKSLKIINASTDATEEMTQYLNACLEKVVANQAGDDTIITYAQILVEKAQRKAVVKLGNDVILASKDGRKTINSLLKFIEDEAYKIASVKPTKALPLKTILENVIEQTERDQNDFRVRTHLPTLDAMIGGFYNGDLIILSARPGDGKTLAAMSIALKAATLDKKSILFFSLEMSSTMLGQRILANYGGHSAWHIRSGNLSADSKKKLNKTSKEIADIQLFIADEPTMTTSSIISLAKRHITTHSVDLIVIDYLQLIDYSGGKNASLNEKTAYISKKLKGLARELNVPVLCLSQFNRKVAQEKRRPAMHDLRDSGAIEQDADIILALHYNADKAKEETDSNIVPIELIVLKHRNGDKGTIDVYYNKKEQKIIEVDKSVSSSQS